MVFEIPMFYVNLMGDETLLLRHFNLIVYNFVCGIECSVFLIYPFALENCYT